MVFQIKRFQNNNFFVEKNPFIVNFPLMDLDLAPYLQPGAEAANPETKFNLVANVVHSGKDVTTRERGRVHKMGESERKLICLRLSSSRRSDNLEVCVVLYLRIGVRRGVGTELGYV